MTQDHDDSELRTTAEREIAARLSPVCRHFPPAEFRRLVRDIAATKRRFARIDAGLYPGLEEEGQGVPNTRQGVKSWPPRD